MRTFVESRAFTARVREFLDDQAYRAFQSTLVSDPKVGEVMKGCGGLRKVRTEDVARGKGKRSGARVIYLDIPEADRIDLIAIYGKHEKDDLTAQQKRVLAALARQAKAESLTGVKKGRRKS